MSWKLPSTRRYGNDKYEIKLLELEDRWAKRFDGFVAESKRANEEIKEQVGAWEIEYMGDTRMEIRPYNNVCERLDSLEHFVNMLIDYLQIERVTTPKHTFYRKKGKKTK